MSNWRPYKFYCLNTIDKINNTYFNNNDENLIKIQNSFNRKANKLINDKKLRWIQKSNIMERLETRTLRRINRLNNQNNINYDLFDTEIFNEPSIYEQLKCIKINEPHDLNSFYQFITNKDIPKNNQNILITTNQ